MVTNAFRALLAEPRAPAPPRRVWRDWVLFVGLLVAVTFEALVRHDIVWEPVAIVIAVGTAFALLWRRTQPLAVVAAVFGVAILTSLLSLTVTDGPIGLTT